MNLEKLKALSEKLNSTNSGSNNGTNVFYQLQDGENIVRILPAVDEEEAFHAEAHMHYVTVEGKTRGVTCMKQYGETCPICDLYRDLWKTHESAGLTRDDDSPYNNKKASYGDGSIEVYGKPRHFFISCWLYIIHDNFLHFLGSKEAPIPLG